MSSELRMFFVLGVFALALPVCVLSSGTDRGFSPQNGFVVFERDQLLGIKDIDNNIIFEPIYEEIMPIDGNGLCIVAIDEKKGLLDLTRSQVLLPCEYYSIEQTGNIFIIDYSDLYEATSAEFLDIQDQFDEVFPSDNPDYLLTYRTNTIADGLEYEFYGVLDKAGSVVLHCEYPSISISDNGIAVIIDRNQQYEYYDLQHGIKVFDDFSFCSVFHDGYAIVRIDRDKYCLIDEAGCRATPYYPEIAVDDRTLWTSNGTFLYRIDSMWYAGITIGVDEAKCIAGPFQCIEKPFLAGNEIFVFPQQNDWLFVAPARNAERRIESIQRFYSYDDCFIYKDGEEKKHYIFPDLSQSKGSYEDAVPFIGNHGFVKANGAWHPIDREGKINESISYTSVEVLMYHNSLFFRCKDSDHHIDYLDGELRCISRCVLSGQ